MQPGCTSGTGLYGWGTSIQGSRLINSGDSVLGTYNTYAYNDLNQLTGSSTGSGTPSLSWVYDRYGNRYQQNATGGGMAPQPQHTVNALNNQITDGGWNYDAAGDLNYDGSNGFTYDAEGNVIAAGSTQPRQPCTDGLRQTIREHGQAKILRLQT